MSRALLVHQAGPGMTVQDLGRPGFLAFGLSRGGAADRLAMAEGAALLGQPEACAAVEMVGLGGTFEATEDLRIALTGAPMRASVEGARLVWNASHALPRGAQLTIGPATRGVYGYLHVGGGIQAPMRLGARSAHMAAGIGAAIQRGHSLAVGADSGGETGLALEPAQRFDGGTIRLVPSLQTDRFPRSEIQRFQDTEFRRDTRGNRMGIRLVQDGAGFHSDAGLSVLSEVIVPGDIQITGDGSPFVLLSECQTTGGYPRIGSVLPCDLPTVAQAQPGTGLRFRFVSLDEACAIERRARERIGRLRHSRRPLVRDPASIPDLLSYHLISGAVSGAETEED